MLKKMVLLLCTMLLLADVSAEEDSTIEQVEANPAKYEGKTLVFKGVAVSGDIAAGLDHFRLTVKTNAGRTIDSKLRKDGFNFGIAKERPSEMTKGFKPDQFYPMTLTCKMERRVKAGWWAIVTNMVGADGTLTGKWKGKYTAGSKGWTTMDLLEASDGKVHGTWTDKEGPALFHGVRTGTRMEGTTSYEQTIVKVRGEISDKGKTLKIKWDETKKDKGKVKNFKGDADFALQAPSTIVLGPTTLSDGKVGDSYRQTITASGGTPPYKNFSVSAGNLPAGLTLSPEGLLSGTPTVSGTFSFTILVTDASTGTGSQDYKLIVSPQSPTPIAIMPANLPNAQVGVAYKQPLTATGGTEPYTFNLATNNGPLPAGLTLSPGGVLSGTPTASGTFSFTVSVNDSRIGSTLSGSRSYTLTVEPEVVRPIVVVNPSSLPDAQVYRLPDAEVRRSYGPQTLEASGGKAPYKFVISSGEIPGLKLSPEGVLSGSPTTIGTFTFTVSANDASTDGPFTGNQTYILIINREPGFWGWIEEMNQRWDSLNVFVKGLFMVLATFVGGCVALKLLWRGEKKPTNSPDAQRKD